MPSCGNQSNALQAKLCAVLELRAWSKGIAAAINRHRPKGLTMWRYGGGDAVFYVGVAFLSGRRGKVRSDNRMATKKKARNQQ